MKLAKNKNKILNANASKTLHLFGAGDLLVTAAKVGLKKNFRVIVRTSHRLFKKKSKWVKNLKKLNVPLFVNNNLSKAMQEGLKFRQGDCGISFGAPWIFSSQWIKAWKKNLFNFHNRPLPKHRGAGGASWIILMNEKNGASTIHEISPGLDNGPILKSEKYRYPKKLKYPFEFNQYDGKKCTNFIVRHLPKILSNKIKRKSQDSNNASYWPRLNTDIHAWINWNWDISDISKFCHAFGNPYTGAKTLINGNIIYLKKIKAIKVKNKYHPFQTGLIFKKSKSGDLYISHPSGELVVSEYLIKSKYPCPKVGDRLMTPTKLIEKALRTRVQYLPSGKIKIYKSNL